MHYLIWGRIEHIAPQQFAVIVSAITEDGRDTAGVIVRLKESREDARQEVAALAVEMGARVRELGGVVQDVEIDD